MGEPGYESLLTIFGVFTLSELETLFFMSPFLATFERDRWERTFPFVLRRFQFTKK
jgi:hypothetical protein